LKGKLFLIHWKAAEAEELADPLRKTGWEVELESEDGARAGRRIESFEPDVAVIYLTRLPSHGRETARYLRTRTATRDVPIVFVDGKQEALEKIRALLPDAKYTTSERLGGVVTDFATD